ncbi:MAG: hypothetical protein M3Z36_01675 [Acidobacteriota bacterium]|nr:hypothetical protein [Acidobacteriota bacterium]
MVSKWRSVGKLYPAYKEMKYTGFGDANFIAARDGIWFFEKCERFGYNAHVNLLFNLSRNGVGDVLAHLSDGALVPEFSGGFGATITMSTRENPTGGKAIQFPPKLWKDIYFWDVFKKAEMYLTAGFDLDGYVLIVNGYGYTMPTAWENVMRKAEQIKFPYRAYRTDGDKTNYATSPIRRYEALRAMDWRYEALVAVHELIELILSKHRGIAEETISEFDIAFEQSREHGQVLGEPGDDPRASYRKEHFFATNVERLLASELGVDWFAYERLVDGLGIKK